MIKHRKNCNFKNWDCFFFRVIQWYSCWLPLQLNHIVCNPIIQKFGLFNHFQGIHMANIFRIFGLEKNTMLGELQIRLSYVHMKNWWFFNIFSFSSDHMISVIVTVSLYLVLRTLPSLLTFAVQMITWSVSLSVEADYKSPFSDFQLK